MKRIGSLILIFFILFWLAGSAPAAPVGKQPDLSGGLSVSADAAILMDARTGQVLYAKNPFKKRPPASTTKVLTALLAIEAGRPDEAVTVSRQAAYTEGSSMYLSVGQTVTMSDLLYGALLNSGNDACAAMAEHIAGSTENFAVLMNMKALALGAVNSRFANPHGLPDKDHYSCAYDLALIARRALANPTFAEIVSTKDKTIDIPGQDWDKKLRNTNRLLWRYLWAEGVKTGTTNAAGPCLISSASKDNRQLVAVVLNSGNRWGDSVKMFEYGFNRFEYQQVAVAGTEFGKYRVYKGSSEEMPVVYSTDLGILVPVGDPGALEKRVSIQGCPEAPVRKGMVIGSVSYLVNHCYVGKTDLVSALDIKREGIWKKTINWLSRQLYNIFRHISA